MTTQQQRMPRGLGSAGKSLWRAMTDEIQYRPDEVVTLTQACKLADTIHDLEQALKGQSMTTVGSAGQDVINPLVTEIRQTRAELTRQLARLDVPESDGGASRSAKARESARQRWHGSRGVA